MNKKRLIELLLECPSLRSAETRHSLLTLLPADIATQIKASDVAKIHVLNIVNTCMDYRDGLKVLLENVSFFDEQTEPFQKLSNFLENQESSAPKSPKPDFSAQRQAKIRQVRYTDNGDGTVTDNRTGLIWLKNANCFGEQNWENAMQFAAQLAHGKCGLSDGSKPREWRLPTGDEWEMMIDKKYVKSGWSQPALSNAAGTGKWEEGDAFSSVQTGYYWSSTTLAGSTTSAWCVGLDGGSVYTGGKSITVYVWPVRGGH